VYAISRLVHFLSLYVEKVTKKMRSKLYVPGDKVEFVYIARIHTNIEKSFLSLPDTDKTKVEMSCSVYKAILRG